jgi:hypothetical protein
MPPGAGVDPAVPSSQAGRRINSCSCSGVIGLLIGPSDTELDATHVLGATRQGTRGMILRQLLESIPDMVDRYMPTELRSHTDIRYFLYWLVLAASIVLSACILRYVAFGVVLLYAFDHKGFARQRKALKAAQYYCPNSATPRSSLARDNDIAVQGKRQVKRRLARAKRLQDFRSETELRWVATAEYGQQRLLSSIYTFTGYFGANFARIPRLGAALRPLVIVGAAVAVLWIRPMHQQDSLRSFASRLWRETTSITATRILPLAVLLLGIVIVTRPSSLIDVIRARDEAAKDANRLLAELNGRLGRLEVAIYHWREYLVRSRYSMLRKWVDHSSDGDYTWDYAGGVSRMSPEHLHRYWSDFPDETTRHEEELAAIIHEISALKNLISDKGLYLVILRQTARVSASMAKLALGTDYRRDEDHFRRSFRTPDHVDRFLRDQEQHVSRRPIGERDELDLKRYEKNLEQTAYNVLRVLDFYALDLMVLERHLRRVRIFLTKRVIGSFWTRALSVVQK